MVVDTGAELLLIANIDELVQVYKLVAVNDSPIATYGHHLLTVNLELRQTFQWVFTVADAKNL